MNDTLLLVLTIFVAIAAFAMLVQACMLVGVFLVARKLQQKAMPMFPQVEAILGISRRTAERAEKQFEQISITSSAVLETTKTQISKMDELLNDASRRAKVQMDRAELVLDDTMTRMQETVAIVQSGVIRPIRELYGIIAGLRTTIAYLGRVRRPTVDHATSDEEMFI